MLKQLDTSSVSVSVSNSVYISVKTTIEKKVDEKC
jgi:hypothetical protein